MCGEKSRVCPRSDPGTGSPPRVRGKETCKKACEVSWGITPACAGKSALRLTAKGPSGDHPRVCGEKKPWFLKWCSDTGSPPRVRGKVPGASLRGMRLGITPACAGKSCDLCQSAAQARDHPRVCGEKPFGRTLSRPKPGSPPRVRGKVHFRNLKEMPFGITPACAGKSPCRKSAKPAGGDHPRVCGEKPGIWSGVR